MPDLEIILPDETEAVHSEEQIRGMIEQGAITLATLHWSDERRAWRPLREYFKRAGVLPAPAPAARVVTYAFTKDPAALTAFLQTMLWGTIAIKIAALAAGGYLLYLLDPTRLDYAALAASDARGRMIRLISLLVYLTTGFAFLRWIYRANINSRGFRGGAGMEFSPGGSIGFYFLPVANLVFPFQAMREIWRVSRGPEEWNSDRGAGSVTGWWACWLTANVAGNVYWQLNRRVMNIESLKTAVWAGIVYSALFILASRMAVRLISEIDRNQRALVLSATPT